MWKYLHSYYQDISHKVQDYSAKHSENMLEKAAHISKAEENVYLLQLLVIADLNRKKMLWRWH